MTTDWQTLAALAVVAAAALLLLRSSFRKKKKPGCGGDCGCPADQFKAKLKL